MALRLAAASSSSSSFSCVSTSFSSPRQSATTYNSQVSLRSGLFDCLHSGTRQLKEAKVKSCQFILGKLKTKERLSKRQYVIFAASDDPSVYDDITSDSTEQEQDLIIEDTSPPNSSFVNVEGTGGRPGFISFYNRPKRSESRTLVPLPERTKSNLLWFVGPAVLVASFIFPSLYLRRILSTIFEDSLLTDFLILFFTEALFYCGVVVFLFIVDHLWRPNKLASCNNGRTPAPQMEYRITSVAILVLSLVIPMVTMGLVWPWTGPAASATLAPYLVGIIVQFAFEQYARFVKSPSWPVIPVIFQVYRLHQLNRAAQLVTALSFTVRGTEVTSHSLAISSSLSTLLNVLQCLGVICIWSLSSFLMRFSPPSTITEA